MTVDFKSPLLIDICITLIIIILHESKRYLLFHPNKTIFNPIPDYVQEIFIKGRKRNNICIWYYSTI